MGPHPPGGSAQPFAARAGGGGPRSGRGCAPRWQRSAAATAAVPHRCGMSPERVRDLKERAWLHRIAVNVVRNRVRGVKPSLVELNGSESDHSPGPEAQAMERMELDELATRVAGLPVRYREAVVLRHVRDLSYAEVAEALGQPVGTVKANVHRGLKILRGDNDDRLDD